MKWVEWLRRFLAARYENLINDVLPFLATLFSRDKKDEIGQVVGAFESETSRVFAKDTPATEHATLYTILGFFGLAFLFMAFTSVERVVEGAGVIVPTRGQIYLSPFNEAIIKEIKVKVGEVVKKNEILATLDPTYAAADLKQIKEKIQSDQAQIARDHAEVADQIYVPGTGSYDNLQFNIWQQRQAQYKADVANFDAQIMNSAATASGLAHDIDQYRKRLVVARQLEGMDQTLEQKGFGSRQKSLTSTDNRLELERLLENDTGQLAATQQTEDSLRAQKASYIQKWHSDAGTDLVTVSNDLDTQKQSLSKALMNNDLVDIRSPVDAVVLTISPANTGSVATTSGGSSAQTPLFTLVPLTGPVEAEADIQANDVGFIRKGDPVEIKLDAYEYVHYGTAKGVVKTISEGSFQVSDQTNQPVPPYFKVRVTVTDTHLHDVPRDFRLIPGMTLAADIVVGHRSILGYIISGALRNAEDSMREPN